MKNRTYFPSSHYFTSDDPTCVVVFDNDTGRGRPLPFAGGAPTHSPTGYAWGYGGSGPAELARAILADHLGRVPEPALYQRFKDAFIATLDQESTLWEITSEEVEAWLQLAAKGRA
jgi:hypothetical protein